MIDQIQSGPVSLYLHFPFCERKCRYCDFLSSPASEKEREEYIGILCRETALRERVVEAAVDTIFLGGGTPSLMTPSQLKKVMETIRASYEVLPDAEISMEVNPGTADIAKLRAYRTIGINRLSIGVQSFDDDELKLLGRIHTADQAREIFRTAREAGFTNINLDLMSALPGQTVASWLRTLSEAVELGPEHISAYSLILEEGTPFASMYDSGQLPELPSEEEDRAMYHFTGEYLARNGYRRYEISNYAREGFACRHNCGYWTGHEYLGLGLGASSDLGGERFRNPADMEEYRKAVKETAARDITGDMPCYEDHTLCKENHNPRCEDYPLRHKTDLLFREDLFREDDRLRRERQRMTIEDRMEEFMFLGLRQTCGVSEKEFERRFGKSLEEVFGDVIRKQVSQGVITRSADEGRIYLTEYGLDVANHVMAEYLI